MQLILLPPRDLDQRFAVTEPNNVVPFPPGPGQRHPKAGKRIGPRVEGTLSDILPYRGLSPFAILPQASSIPTAISRGSNGSMRSPRRKRPGILATNDVHYATPDGGRCRT